MVWWSVERGRENLTTSERGKWRCGRYVLGKTEREQAGRLQS